MSRIRLVRSGMPNLLPMTSRSPGTHVSDVIHSLCVLFGHFSGDVNLTTTWAQLGCALETAIANRYHQQYPNTYISPGELERDGIFGTPDLLNLPRWMIHEIKLTWMSPSHSPDSEKFWRYWVQVMCYCHMIECGSARLHVAHVNGDRRKGKSDFGPVYNVWHRDFTSRELKDNWKMIKQHQKDMKVNEIPYVESINSVTRQITRHPRKAA